MFWLWSSLLALHQEQSRRERIAKAEEQLEELQAQLTSSRSRRRSHEELEHRVDAILGGQQVGRWLTVKIHGTESHRFRQATRGRPGPGTSYVRRTTRGWRLEWLGDENVIAYDHKSDGMYPSCRARHEGYYAACPIMPRRKRSVRVWGSATLS